MDDELAVTEMLDFVDYNSERAAQEAADDEEMLLWVTERRIFFDAFGDPILGI